MVGRTKNEEDIMSSLKSWISLEKEVQELRRKKRELKNERKEFIKKLYEIYYFEEEENNRILLRSQIEQFLLNERKWHND